MGNTGQYKDELFKVTFLEMDKIKLKENRHYEQ